MCDCVSLYLVQFFSSILLFFFELYVLGTLNIVTVLVSIAFAVTETNRNECHMSSHRKKYLKGILLEVVTCNLRYLLPGKMAELS